MSASTASSARPRLQFFSHHPGKRRTEQFWLAYTAVWGISMGAVMVLGLGERWGDLELMILGVILAGGAVLGPLVFRAEEEKGLPFYRLAGFKLGVSVFGFACFLNYSQTPYFYDVLHMHYGFATEWNIQNNPFFLYLVSVAYFATYCALINIAFRVVKSGLASAPTAVRIAGYCVVPFAVAFLETALNANPFIDTLFCYDDMKLMLWFGTLSYGAAFVFALPMWISIDEEPGQDVPLFTVVVWLFAAMYADVIVLDLLRYNVAPHLTTVIEGANGLRDYGHGCLRRPTP